jgi:hypothetical protein
MPAAPSDNYGVQFSYNNPGIAGEFIKRRLQGTAQSQSSDEHPGILYSIHAIAGQLRKQYFGPAGMGVHQHTAVQGYKKIRTVPLAKFKKTISGITAVKGLPRFAHPSCLLIHFSLDYS